MFIKIWNIFVLVHVLFCACSRAPHCCTMSGFNMECCFLLVKVLSELMIFVMRDQIYVVINMVTAKDIQQLHTWLAHWSKCRAW